MTREPVEKWPKPGTPRPTGPARVWAEVELEMARQEIAALKQRIAQLEQLGPPTGDT